MSRPATLPEKMSREELLAYVQILEGQCRHDGAKIEMLNATVRKLESDAVITIAALVHQLGDEAVIMPSIVDELRNYQIGRTTRHEDNATILRIAKKPTPQVPVEPTDDKTIETCRSKFDEGQQFGDEPKFQPDGL